MIRSKILSRLSDGASRVENSNLFPIHTMGGGPAEADTPRARAAAAAAARFEKAKSAAAGGSTAAAPPAATTAAAAPSPSKVPSAEGGGAGGGAAAAGGGADSDDDMDDELRAALAMSMRPATPPAARAPLEDMIGLTASIKEVVWGASIDPSERTISEVLR